MKLSTSLVAVKKINSYIPRSNFSNDKLEQVAQLILKAEGVINPLVLHRTSLESYEVVDGHFEYYAAARAREIDPRKGEMIGAFILEEENEGVIQEQIKILRKQKKDVDEKENIGSFSIENSITNIELRIETLIQEFKSEQLSNRQKLEEEFKNIQNQISNGRSHQISDRMSPLDVFNDLNVTDLTSNLKSAGFADKKANQIAEIIECERKNGKFNSLIDVVERVKIKHGQRQNKCISSDKMVDIIDRWSRISFS